MAFGWGAKPSARQQPTPEAPVRAGQVKRVAKALDDRHVAAVCDEGPSGHREYRQAEAVVDAAMRNATPAEVKAAYKAMRW